MDDQDSIPGSGDGVLFLLHSVQIGSETHPVSYPMNTGNFFPRGKTAGA
jgi:hypothetical protein